MTAASTTSNPQDSVDCSVGDYLLRREADGRWRVYLVEDFVRLTRQVPLRVDGGPGLSFIDEGTTLDSVTPAYLGQTYLLLTARAGDFADGDAARRAVESGSLAVGAEKVLRSLGEFPKSATLTVHGVTPHE